MLRARPSIVNFCRVGSLSVATMGWFLSMSFSTQAQAQNIDWQNEFDRCYALQWYPEEAPKLRTMPQDFSSSITWYCQAKPRSASAYIYRQYQSYQDEWLDAVDFSVLRCERGENESCTYRCALAPRVCAPHFWP